MPPAVISDMREGGRKENTRLDFGKNERKGERSENESKTVKKEARTVEKRGTLVTLGRANVKPENERTKMKIENERTKLKTENEPTKLEIGEKDLDSVVRKIKNKEVERRSGKDAQRSSLEEKESLGGEFSGFNSNRASLSVRSPEARNRQVTENGRDLGRSAGGGRGSRKQEQLLSKIRRGPPMAAPAPTRLKEWRPKGRTIRKAHYDPREVG